ncbi:MAG: hypothetical protein RLZZ494_1036, partial [Pseudomonadota bacterium]
GTDAVTASISGYVLAANVENLVLAGTAAAGTGNVLNNVITGNAVNNVLDGGVGDDSLFGMAGNDSLISGSGFDSLIGGTGDDTYVINNSNVAVTELAGEGTDLVQVSFSYTLGDNIENLTLVGEFSSQPKANTGKPALGECSPGSGPSGTGNDLNNLIIGDSCDNLLDGDAGADTLIGGLGNDTYVIDNGGDIVTETAGAGTDWVKSSVSYIMPMNIENLILTGFVASSGIGNPSDNVITGNNGNNVLDGGSGDDTLIGGSGDDTLIGGSGDDTIAYAIGDGNDTIIADATTMEASDVLRLGSGIAKSNLSATQKDLNLEINIGNTGTLTVTNFYDFYEVGAYTIGSIELADGTTLYLNDEATLDALISTTAIPL